MSYGFSPMTGGQYFQDSPVQQQPNYIGDTKEKASLIIFAPTRGFFQDTAVRPLMYNFDQNFTSKIEELTKASTIDAIGSGAATDYMQNTFNLNDYMTMHQQANIGLNASHLNDFFRFILIFTNDRDDLITGSTMFSSSGGASSIRRIYTGFFMDEPVNMRTYSSHHRTYNQHARMVFTHKTRMSSIIDSALGGRQKLTTQSSENVLPVDIFNQVKSTSLLGHEAGSRFMMTPENCLNSVGIGDDGYSYSTPSVHSEIGKDSGTITTADLLEQPVHNLRRTIDSVIATSEQQAARARLGNLYGSPSGFDQQFLTDGFRRTALAQNLSIGQSSYSTEFDLDMNKEISIDKLDALVNGTLKIDIIDIGEKLYFDRMDTFESSITAKFSHLIATILAPLMSAAGLNNLVFVYAIRMNGVPEPFFRAERAASSQTLVANDIEGMVNAVKIELHKGIFRTIFEALGDFEVHVSCNIVGMTEVKLSLVEQGYICRAPFEMPTCLGGMISPLIGDYFSEKQNVESAELLMAAMNSGAQQANQYGSNSLNALPDLPGW